jgi:hypothetical protein
MKNPLTGERVSTGCVGCDFVKEFTPHEGGWCREHGDIEGTPKRELGADTIIEKLGGNELSLLEG